MHRTDTRQGTQTGDGSLSGVFLFPREEFEAAKGGVAIELLPMEEGRYRMQYVVSDIIGNTVT